ncbi:hypothetical protein B0H13DRAFT_2386680 [Mycena leptocephala]|nr:hypothetical protein B0H13DRAFT_2386680 [Mycena leptocephala]
MPPPDDDPASERSSSDEEMASRSDMSDDESDEEQPEPLSLTQIAMDDAVNHCDICQRSLGADTDVRAFRCYNCELSVQHLLQEWDNVAQTWGEQQNISALMSGMAKICDKCETELAGRAGFLPTGTVMCADCEGGLRLLCRRCCLLEHACRPLHRIQVWEGAWQDSTLAQIGLIYHLAHGGDPSRQRQVLRVR